MRYDGIYRIASCWRSKGAQGYLVCRYLFVRCDNSPAPWSSEGAEQLLARFRDRPASTRVVSRDCLPGLWWQS